MQNKEKSQDVSAPTYSEISQKLTGIYNGDGKQVVPDIAGCFNTKPISAITGYDFIWADTSLFDCEKQKHALIAAGKPQVTFNSLSQSQSEYAKTWKFDTEKPNLTGVYKVATYPTNVLINTDIRKGTYLRYVEPMLDIWSREMVQPDIALFGPRFEDLYNVLQLDSNKNNYTYIDTYIDRLNKRGYRILTDATLLKPNKHYINAISTALNAIYDATLFGDFSIAQSVAQNLAEYVLPNSVTNDPIQTNTCRTVFMRALFGLIDYLTEEALSKESLKMRQQKIEDNRRYLTQLSAYLNELFQSSDIKIKGNASLFESLTTKAHGHVLENAMRMQDNALKACTNSDEMIKLFSNITQKAINKSFSNEHTNSIYALDLTQATIGNYLQIRFSNLKNVCANVKIINSNNIHESSVPINQYGSLMLPLADNINQDLQLEIEILDNSSITKQSLHYSIYKNKLYGDLKSVLYYKIRTNKKPLLLLFDNDTSNFWMQLTSIYNMYIMTCFTKQNRPRALHRVIFDSANSITDLELRLCSDLGINENTTIITKNIDAFAKNHQMTRKTLDDNIGIWYDFTEASDEADPVQLSKNGINYQKVYLPYFYTLTRNFKNNDSSSGLCLYYKNIFNLKKQFKNKY